MPQLVATMIMRHREKAGRSSGKERKSERARRASSSKGNDQAEEITERRSGLGQRVIVGEDLVVRDGDEVEAKQ